MTDNSDPTPPRKTLSIKRPRSAEGTATAPREVKPARTPLARETANREREPASNEPRAGRLFALDDHMRRMQADMDQLGSKKDPSTR